MKNRTVEQLRNEAMMLSVSERASLAYDLILTLDDPDNFELSSEQESEIQRRVKSVQEGRAVGRSTKEVFASIRAKFE